MSFGRLVAGALLFGVLTAPVSAQVATERRPGPAQPTGAPKASAAAAPFNINTIDPETFHAIALRIPDGMTPRIDGRLDEPVWQQAPVSGHFLQREPKFGAPASERTEFRILYDDRRLYFGVWAYDSDPTGIRASELKRDAQLGKSDHIKINIDTFHDHRNAFYFATNPLAARKDAHLIENGKLINYDWNPIWECKTSVDASGWYVEIAIPFSQVRFRASPGETVWGLNVGRVIVRRNEDSYWVVYPREWGAAGSSRMSRAGMLDGLKGMGARRRFEFMPFAAPSFTQNFDAGTPGDLSAKYGFDMRVGVTSDLTADLTYKTDFAQVEADQEVVNLSRFSLFFPEKRQFFAESIGIFNYGQQAERPASVTEQTEGLLTLFYSRRIGLSSDGLEIPITAGAKMTGHAGPYTVGFMNVETDRATFGSDPLNQRVVPRANYTVARVKRQITSLSQIGAIFVNRQGGAGGDYNRAVGVDASFLFGSSTSLTGVLAKTMSPGATGKDVAGAVDLLFRKDRYNWGATYVDVGERFDAQVGYVPRLDVRNVKAKAAWTPRPRWWRGVRQLTVSGDVNYFENHAGKLDSRTLGLDFIVSRQDSSSFNFSFGNDFDQLPFDWYFGSGHIPKGAYDWNTLGASYSSNKSKRVYGGGSVNVGGYYNGSKRTYAGNLNFLLLTTLLVETQYTRNELRLPLASLYATNTISTRVSYSFSPDLYLKSFIQYNDEKRLASFNVLFWYVYRPGSDLYIVYNEGWETDIPGPRTLRARNRSLSAKLTYWLSR